MSINYSTQERIEVYRFNPIVAVGVPLAAIVLQAFLPVQLRWLRILDLPLLVTIYFAVARRNQITGLMTGAIIGLLQDILANQPIGIYGIAKTIVAYCASSLGAKIDVDNPGSRLLITFGFFLMHQFLYFTVARYMVGLALQWSWGHEMRGAVVNAVAAVAVFFVLDRFKQS